MWTFVYEYSATLPLQLNDWKDNDLQHFASISPHTVPAFTTRSRYLYDHLELAQRSWYRIIRQSFPCLSFSFFLSRRRTEIVLSYEVFDLCR